ncbi:hypothetical protein B0H17DRAFT_1135376 [Mycena rosella]|uniref:Uncharacterized protein n=1 Tax=Mycena rosella TaxID=1033263 RepID=A0AAD7GHY3_MYCRO|nr:hypothetical protein B0H17DRAFT_1135376 [Mycena rosella]
MWHTRLVRVRGVFACASPCAGEVAELRAHMQACITEARNSAGMRVQGGRLYARYSSDLYPSTREVAPGCALTRRLEADGDGDVLGGLLDADEDTYEAEGRGRWRGTRTPPTRARSDAGDIVGVDMDMVQMAQQVEMVSFVSRQHVTVALGVQRSRMLSVPSRVSFVSRRSSTLDVCSGAIWGTLSPSDFVRRSSIEVIIYQDPVDREFTPN